MDTSAETSHSGPPAYIFGIVFGVAGVAALCYAVYKTVQHREHVKIVDQHRVEFYAAQELMVQANEREREMHRLEALAEMRKKRLNAEQTEEKKRSRREGGGLRAVSPAHMSDASNLVSSDESQHEAMTVQDDNVIARTHSPKQSMVRTWESAMEEGPQLPLDVVSEVESMSSGERDYLRIMAEDGLFSDSESFE